MNSVSSFYDELDLKYPEIAICIERIDRLNPGSPKFVIPVLTPNMSIDTESSQSIHQNTSNLRNSDVNPEITDIIMNNYMQIPLPKELCGNYDSKFLQCVRFLADTTLSCSSSSENCHGTLNKKFNTLYEILSGMTSSRYIEKGSKWIVVFVGGDITKPRIIAPYEHLSEEG